MTQKAVVTAGCPICICMSLSTNINSYAHELFAGCKQARLEFPGNRKGCPLKGNSSLKKSRKMDVLGVRSTQKTEQITNDVFF